MSTKPFTELSWPEKLAFMNKYDNFSRLYGIKLVEYAAGFARLEMQLTPVHWNSQKRLHGGWSAALLVIAANKAALSYGFKCQISTLSMNYFHGVAEGNLQIVAKERQRDEHWAVYEVDISADNELAVASGTICFVPSRESLDWHLRPAPTCERQFASRLPEWPAERADLHADIPGLRPCFKQADWQGKAQYLNETENFHYTEGIELTEYKAGHCRMEFANVQPQNLNPDGILDPAWLAVLMDQLIGKASLYDGYFNVTAQTSINFYEAYLNNSGGVYGVAEEKSRDEHFCVFSGDITDAAGELLASGTCTMYLRHKEIDFQRERPSQA